jgi:hypothetical protein
MAVHRHLKLPMSTLTQSALDELMGGCVGLDFVGAGDDRLSPAVLQGSGRGETVFNIPNALTLAGYAAGLAWLMGYGPAWALLSIVLDELDGKVARDLNQTSEFGAELDLAVDWSMAALVGVRIGTWWAMPAMLGLQVWQHQQGKSPVVGSARAAGMIYAMARGI